MNRIITFAMLSKVYEKAVSRRHLGLPKPRQIGCDDRRKALQHPERQRCDALERKDLGARRLDLTCQRVDNRAQAVRVGAGFRPDG